MRLDLQILHFLLPLKNTSKLPQPLPKGAEIGNSLSRDVLPPSARLGNLSRQPAVGKARALWR